MPPDKCALPPVIATKKKLFSISSDSSRYSMYPYAYANTPAHTHTQTHTRTHTHTRAHAHATPAQHTDAHTHTHTHARTHTRTPTAHVHMPYRASRQIVVNFYIRFYCFCFSFGPSLLCHLPQSRALAAGEQPGRIKVHWSSAEISAWFPLLLQPTASVSVSARAYSCRLPQSRVLAAG